MPGNATVKVTVGSMMMENTVTFCNCCSPQAMADRNLKLSRIVKNPQSVGNANYFNQYLCLALIFMGLKMEKFVKCEPE